MAYRILIIEDEQDLVRTLQYNLEREGYTTRSASTAVDALRLVSMEPLPDLVLLDLMLPDMSGIEVCRRIRGDESTRHIPVIILTAKGEEIDRVIGFEVGADDYVVKPFSVRELLLRVRAILRRAPSAEQVHDEDNASTEVRFGRLRIDFPAYQAWVDDEEVRLTALEFKLLATLFERRGRVQSREVLLSDVWDITADVMTRTVDTHIKRLREKLGVAGDYIETLRGVGYRFSASPPLESLSGQD